MLLWVVLLGCASRASDNDVHPLSWDEAPAVLYDADGAIYCVKPGLKYPWNVRLYRLSPGQVKADCALLNGGKP